MSILRATGILVLFFTLGGCHRDRTPPARPEAKAKPLSADSAPRVETQAAVAKHEARQDVWAPVHGVPFQSFPDTAPWPRNWSPPAAWLEGLEIKHGFPGHPLKVADNVPDYWESKVGATSVGIGVKMGTDFSTVRQNCPDISISDQVGSAQICERTGSISLFLWAATPPMDVALRVRGLPPDEARRRLLAFAEDIVPRMKPAHLRQPTAEIQVFAGTAGERAAVLARWAETQDAVEHWGGLAPGFPKIMRTSDLHVRAVHLWSPLPEEVVVFSVCPFGGSNAVQSLLGVTLPRSEEWVFDSQPTTLQCPAVGMQARDSSLSGKEYDDGYVLLYGVTESPAGATDGARGYAVLRDAKGNVVAQAPVTHPAIPNLHGVPGRFSSYANREIESCSAIPNEASDGARSSHICRVKWSDYVCADDLEREDSEIQITVTPDHRIEISAPRITGPRNGAGCRKLE